MQVHPHLFASKIKARKEAMVLNFLSEINKNLSDITKI